MDLQTGADYVISDIENNNEILTKDVLGGHRQKVAPMTYKKNNNLKDLNNFEY